MPRKVKLSRTDEQRAEQLYGRKWRQIRRWVERGEQNNDLCPLFEPAKMPAWWSRNFTWRVPAEIEAAAISASQSSGDNPQNLALPASAPPEASSTESNNHKPIHLEDFDPEEGAELRSMKQILAAQLHEIRERMARGSDCTLATKSYFAMSETVDKIESRVTERLKKRGLYILRDAVERDNAAAAELMRQSGVSLGRRVLERCPSLNADQRAEVSAAIDNAWTVLSRILARLSSSESSPDLLSELAA